MTELSRLEGMPPKPQASAEDRHLLQPVDASTAADTGEPVGPELLDQNDDKVVVANEQPDIEARDAEAQQDQRDAGGTAGSPEADGGHAEAVGAAAGPAGKVAATGEVERHDEATPPVLRDHTSSASDKSSDAVIAEHDPEPTAPGNAEPLTAKSDHRGDADASDDDLSANADADVEQAAPGEPEDQEVPIGDNGAKGPPDGGDVPLLRSGGDDEGKPWKRNPDMLRPEVRAAALKLERLGPGTLELSDPDNEDEILVGYPELPEGTGYISGTVDVTPGSPRTTVDVMNITPDLRGLGLSTPLVDRFAQECEQRGIEIIDGWIDSPEELGALHSVFGDAIAFGDASAPNDDDAMMIPLTVEQAFQSLSRERAEDLEMEEGMSALVEARRERTMYPSLYFEARPEGRVVRADAETVDVLPAVVGQRTKEAAEAFINLDRIDAEDEQVATGVEIVNEISAGRSVRAALDTIAREYPEAGLGIAVSVQSFMSETGMLDADVDPNVLLWIKANLTSDLTTQGSIQPVDAAIQKQIGDAGHDWLQINAAATWAEYGNKTARSVTELVQQMATVERALTESPAQIPIQAILARHREPYNTGMVAGYGIQPLTAEYVGTTDLPGGPKLTMLNNQYCADVAGGETIRFIASAPMGVMIYRQERAQQVTPQQIISFDVVGSMVTIRDIELASASLLSRKPGGPLDIPKEPILTTGFDMSEVALEVVPRLCVQLGFIADPDNATFRIISVMNSPYTGANVDKLTAAMRRYDQPAGAHGMYLDAENNWIAPLSKFLPG